MLDSTKCLWMVGNMECPLDRLNIICPLKVIFFDKRYVVNILSVVNKAKNMIWVN